MRIRSIIFCDARMHRVYAQRLYLLLYAYMPVPLLNTSSLQTLKKQVLYRVGVFSAYVRYALYTTE